MLTTSSSVERRLAALIVLVAFVNLSLVTSATFVAADLEFHRAWPQTEHLPQISLFYRAAYPYSWFFVAGALAWALLLVSRQYSSLSWIILYVSTVCTVGVFWTFFTLFAFYLKNQSFLV